MALGKGQMGSALMGPLQISCGGDLLGTPVNRFVSQKCQGVPFSPNLSKFMFFAAAPFVLTPFVHKQGKVGGIPAGDEESAAGQEGGGGPARREGGQGEEHGLKGTRKGTNGVSTNGVTAN